MRIDSVHTYPKLDDKTLQECSAIVNRRCWVEAVPHLRDASLLVRRKIMVEKFRRAVQREQIKAA